MFAGLVIVMLILRLDMIIVGLHGHPRKGVQKAPPPPPPALWVGAGGVYCTYIHTNIQNMLLEVLHDK